MLFHSIPAHPRAPPALTHRPTDARLSAALTRLIRGRPDPLSSYILIGLGGRLMIMLFDIEILLIYFQLADGTHLGGVSGVCVCVCVAAWGSGDRGAARAAV